MEDMKGSPIEIPISSVEDFKQIGTAGTYAKGTSYEGYFEATYSSKYCLVNNIDLEGDSHECFCRNFYGELDGQGFVIENGSINNGLIDINFGIINNVNFKNVSVFGDDMVGALARGNAGEVRGCNGFEGIYMHGEINVGGLVGVNMGVVENSKIKVEVDGIELVGGIAGSNKGYIGYSESSGYVKGDRFVGGISGVTRGDIENSISKSGVEGKDYVGGISGGLYEGSWDHTINTGKVSGESLVGGITGELSGGGKIGTSINKGEVMGKNCIGGITGQNTHGTLVNVRNHTDVKGVNCIGGIVGVNHSFIDNVSNEGNYVNGRSELGGIAGENKGTIYSGKNYSILPDKGENVDGIAGKNSGILSGCSDEINNGPTVQERIREIRQQSVNVVPSQGVTKL